MKGTWKTDNHGSGVLVLVVVVAVIAAAGAAVAGPVVHAADVLLRIALITVASLAGLGIAGAVVVVILAARARRKPPPWTVQVQSARRHPQRAVQAPAAAQRILPPQIHLHLHGPVSAADVAELIARQGNPQPAAIEDEPWSPSWPAYLVTDPTGAAGVVLGILYGLHHAASSLSSFASHF